MEAQAGFYNELMALGDVVAKVQSEIGNAPISVWSDPAIQAALSVCDPDHPKYNPDAAEDTYTRTYDRMLVILKSALRMTVSEAGLANAEDARVFERTGVK